MVEIVRKSVMYVECVSWGWLCTVPQRSGITYGRAKNINGKARESRETVMKDGVFEAYGIRSVAPKFDTSRIM